MISTFFWRAACLFVLLVCAASVSAIPAQAGLLDKLIEKGQEAVQGKEEAPAKAPPKGASDVQEMEFKIPAAPDSPDAKAAMVRVLFICQTIGANPGKYEFSVTDPKGTRIALCDANIWKRVAYMPENSSLTGEVKCLGPQECNWRLYASTQNIHFNEGARFVRSKNGPDAPVAVKLQAVKAKPGETTFLCGKKDKSPIGLELVTKEGKQTICTADVTNSTVTLATMEQYKAEATCLGPDPCDGAISIIGNGKFVSSGESRESVKGNPGEKRAVAFEIYDPKLEVQFACTMRQGQMELRIGESTGGELYESSLKNSQLICDPDMKLRTVVVPGGDLYVAEISCLGDKPCAWDIAITGEKATGRFNRDTAHAHTDPGKVYKDYVRFSEKSEQQIAKEQAREASKVEITIACEVKLGQIEVAFSKGKNVVCDKSKSSGVLTAVPTKQESEHEALIRCLGPGKCRFSITTTFPEQVQVSFPNLTDRTMDKGEGFYPTLTVAKRDLEKEKRERAEQEKEKQLKAAPRVEITFSCNVPTGRISFAVETTRGAMWTPLCTTTEDKTETFRKGESNSASIRCDSKMCRFSVKIAKGDAVFIPGGKQIAKELFERDEETFKLEIK